LPKQLQEDACGIPYRDELGRRIDFHALRHSFNTMLQRRGLSPRAIMELMRHSDLRLSTGTYMDST
jgi:integrase